MGTAWYRRGIPWGGIIVSLLVVVSAMFAVDPVRDAATFAGVGEARLDVSRIGAGADFQHFDTLTLLTVGQHIALLLGDWRIRAVARAARDATPSRSRVRPLPRSDCCSSF